MKPGALHASADWKGASFRDAELDILFDMARLSVVEKIRWIEEAEEFGLRFQRRRWRAGEGVDPRFVDHLRAEDRRAAGELPTTRLAEPHPPFQRPRWMEWMD